MVCEVTVIIPAFNDEKRIVPTLEKVVGFLEAQSYTSEILVVTDGSTDRTVAVSESFISRFQNMRVIYFPFNKGKGFGVKEGMMAARGEYRLFMDADSATPVEYLTPFLEELKKGADIVIGSRAMAESKIITSQNFVRREMARVFRLFQWFYLRLPFPDTQCGFKMFTAESAEKYFPKLTYDCAFFDTELLYLAHRSGAKIVQLPVEWTHDNDTRLPIGFMRSLDLFEKLLKIPAIHRSVR